MGPTDEQVSRALHERRVSFLGASGRRLSDDSEPLNRSFVLAVCALVFGTIVGSTLVRSSPIAEPDSIVVATVLASASGVLAVVAGALCIARFRLNHDRVALAAGVILFVIGLAWILPARVGPMLRPDWRQYVTSAVVASTAVIAVLAGAAILRPTIDATLRLRVFAGWSLAAFGVLASLAFVIGGEFERSDATTPAVAQLLTTPVLGLTAVLFLVVGQRRARWMMMFLGLGLLGLQGSELYAANADTVASAEWLAASLLVLVAMGVALRGVIIEFRLAFLSQQQQLFETWTDLQISSRRAESERAKQEEAMHDLRAGLLGVEAVAQSGQLRSAAAAGLLTTELSRLRSLTVTDGQGAAPVDIVELLAGIVELRLLKGEAVTLVAPTNLQMEVETNHLAEVVFNLLDNAARHAPGAPVVVHVKRSEVGIDIAVQDRGPGVPEELVGSLFKRGVTSHSDGSGLGLYIASALVKAFGGTLRYEPRLGGGSRFVFDIPDGPPRPLPSTEEDLGPPKRRLNWSRRRTDAGIPDQPVSVTAPVPTGVSTLSAGLDTHTTRPGATEFGATSSEPASENESEVESLDATDENAVAPKRRGRVVPLWASADEDEGG